MRDGRVLEAILYQLPAACADCRKYLTRLIPYGLHEVGADQIAKEMGFPSRAALARRLGKHGFPSLKHLRHWILFIHVMESWHSTRLPLQRWAWQNGVDPSVCYRAVRLIAGESWERARRLALSHWLDHFGVVVGERVRCDRRPPVMVWDDSRGN
jgi:hypothetical protein